MHYALHFAELAVILFLVWQLNRARDHEVKAVLDVMADNTAERAELLNAARHPTYLLPQQETSGPVEDPEELERQRRALEAMAMVGRVEIPE
jgi:hypothetical protein